MNEMKGEREDGEKARVVQKDFGQLKKSVNDLEIFDDELNVKLF